MAKPNWRLDHIVDCHVHFRKLDVLEHFLEIRRYVGAARMNIVCIIGPDSGAMNMRGLYAKAVGDGAFYCFGGLNHSTYVSEGKVKAPPFPEQIDHMLAAGYDGLKLIESKPSVRRDWYPFALDSDYYEGFFAHAEELDAPVLWHVGDPAYYWEHTKAPPAEAKGDGLGPRDVKRRQLYQEVENVLNRHPRLRVIFAHFYFLSGELDRARQFLTDHPNAHFDLALGGELLYKLSDDPARSREFFVEFQDRIYYGTDISDRNAFNFAANKAEMIRKLLETDETFTQSGPDGAVVGPEGRTEIRGMSLPDEVLRKVYAGNFEAFVGGDPKPINFDNALEEFERGAALSAAMSKMQVEDTDSGRCLKAIRELIGRA